MKKYSVVICTCLMLLAFLVPCMAQTNVRAQQQEGDADVPLSQRALARFPRTAQLPDDVIWSREIYRTIDLTNGANGALYYPIEPMGDRMNLFTQIFQLLGRKQIAAYEYGLDGVERLSPDKEVEFKDILDRFGIYYQEKRLKNRKDSVLVIDPSDVPSGDVLSYFIKEVWYFDQRTSTYGSVITAVCPVLHRAEDFSTEKMKLPMFWVDYQALSPYLAGMQVMSSNYNHAMNSSVADFFATKQYKGDIYKTTNLQNRSLAHYCENDSAMANEQRRIESELVQFEKNLYGNDLDEAQKAAQTKTADKVVTLLSGDEPAKTKAKAAQTGAPRTNSKKKGMVSNGTTRSYKDTSVKASVRRERR